MIGVLISLTLLYAVPVEAGVRADWSCTSTDNQCRVSREYFTKLQRDRDCVSTMEAALKALHPFSMLNLEPVHMQFGLDMVKKRSEWDYKAELPYEDPAERTPYGLTQTLNAKAGLAIVLWDVVTRECLNK